MEDKTELKVRSPDEWLQMFVALYKPDEQCKQLKLCQDRPWQCVFLQEAKKIVLMLF